MKTSSTRIHVLLPFIALFVISCAQNGSSGGPPFSIDLVPPQIQSAQVIDERTLLFKFDEPVLTPDTSLTFNPALSLESVVVKDEELTLRLAETQEIGSTYVLNLDVSDKAGNTLSFLYRFTGWNPRIPEILINELTPQGSKTNPDCVELYTKSAGNLGGMVLIIGTAERSVGEFIFPVMEVEKNAYIIVHAKAEGTKEEVNETSDKTASGGRLSLDTAWDFWMPGAPGLPGNNGAVTLYSRVEGRILDAVLWSNRSTNLSDEKLGWTSEGYQWAQVLGAAKVWHITKGSVPAPSDAVSSSYTTSTRSLSRASASTDTDSAADWHTVPTKGLTMGRENSDAVHVP